MLSVFLSSRTNQCSDVFMLVDCFFFHVCIWRVSVGKASSSWCLVWASMKGKVDVYECIVFVSKGCVDRVAVFLVGLWSLRFFVLGRYRLAAQHLMSRGMNVKSENSRVTGMRSNDFDHWHVLRFKVCEVNLFNAPV